MQLYRILSFIILYTQNRVTDIRLCQGEIAPRGVSHLSCNLLSPVCNTDNNRRALIEGNLDQHIEGIMIKK